MGIDIGKVDSIAQISSPPSVTCLRQRVGRSGRQDNSPILRLFVIEDKIEKHTNPLDRLRLKTVQCVAMVNLMLENCCEPAPNNKYHFSTLVQQTLSVIGQYGGVRANQLWSLLCATGPFYLVDQKKYAIFLKELGKRDLITQMNDGSLVLGIKGEELTGHYGFYTAFYSAEEYRLEYEGRLLGSIPIDTPLAVEDTIIFNGKYWQVASINSDRKIIVLKKGTAGRPLSFTGLLPSIHDVVRQEMQRIYKEKSIPVYLDRRAGEFVSEGIDSFYSLKLDKTSLLETEGELFILSWQGDQTANTIVALLWHKKLNASYLGGGVIKVKNCTSDIFLKAAEEILSAGQPTEEELVGRMGEVPLEKHERFVPDELLRLSYARKFFNVAGAIEWLRRVGKTSRL